MGRMELRRRWLDMFEPQEPMLALARDLAGRYRVHLLSNVGELHWAHMAREYGLDRLGHGTLTVLCGRCDEAPLRDLCAGRAPLRPAASDDRIHR